MANKTRSQRYNENLEKIFAKSNGQGHKSLHGSIEAKKAKVAGKMKPYKISKQRKGEGEHEHWRRTEKEFYAHGKDLPKGKPASFYKNLI